MYRSSAASANRDRLLDLCEPSIVAIAVLLPSRSRGTRRILSTVAQMMRRSLRSRNRIFTSGGSLLHGEEEALDETASPETLIRTIVITAVNARVSLSSSSDRNPEPEFESHASI